MYNLITIKDAFVVPFLLLVAYLLSTKIRNSNIDKKPYYKYFRMGLFVKIFAGFVFALIYLFYYGGGDTVYYFWGSGSIVKMFAKDIPTFFKLLGGNHSAEVFSMFDRTTGWPTYFRAANSFSVCRFNVPFYLLGFGSFLGNTIAMNLVLFFGIWQFYKMLVELFPCNEKWLAYAMFFIPSVVFWSSGLLKDGWTLVAILGIFTSFYHVFIAKTHIRSNIFWLIAWGFIAFSIRPFMLYASLGATLIWLGFSSIKTIKSRFLRVVALPFIMLVTWALGATLFTQISSQAGNRYSSVDAMLETAWIIQDDLKKDYYGGNSFDIGNFEPTLSGVIKKAPKAIVAGLFRPFIWEGDGVLMLFSGLENLVILLLSIYTFLKFRGLLFFKNLFSDPILLAFFVLAVSLAFSVGLTTSNFGALVRYAIPVKLIIVLLFAILLGKTYTNSSNI